MTSRRTLAALALVASANLVGCGHPGSGSGWTVTVYYTAVESLHSELAPSVRGCLTIDCANGDADLGSYPADFVRAVHDEGTGRVTSAPNAGHYLNWSSDVGYWLDTAARAADGKPLVPFHTAAADGLAQGATVRLTACGSEQDGPPAPAVCGRLREPTWTISDAFTPGLGGDLHIDLYIGEETGVDFTDDPMFTTLVGAVVTVSR